MRLFLALSSFRQLKKDMALAEGKETYWQAGKSVGAVHRIRSAAEIITELEAAISSTAEMPLSDYSQYLFLFLFSHFVYQNVYFLVSITL